MKTGKTTPLKTGKSHINITTNSEEKSTDTFTSQSQNMSFEEYFPMLCNRYQCPFNVFVKKEYESVHVPKFHKYSDEIKKNKLVATTSPYVSADVSDTDVKSPSEIQSSADVERLIVTATYDNLDHLVAIRLFEMKKIPKILIQILCLILPNYFHLTKITIAKCCNNIYVIHELTKMLRVSSITDICLDESPLVEANYATLLDEVTNLRNLSLQRCNINDEVCGTITSKLHYKASAEKHLLLLNMASNHITDIGAKYISEALRSNRHLRYLNLSDNYINDEGAAHIFNILIDFPLTADEVTTKRRRYMNYLVSRHKLLMKVFTDISTQSEDDCYKSKSTVPKSQTKSRKTSTTSLKPKIAKKDKDTKKTNCDLIDELMGPFIDPFSGNSVFNKDGDLYSVGNMVLSYLNLAYNNLSYLSLKKILAVLQYQTLIKKPPLGKLIRVVIEGNYLPNCCSEFKSIDILMNKSMIMPRQSVAAMSVTKKKSRVKIE